MFIPKIVEVENRKIYIFIFLSMMSVYFGNQAWQILMTNFAVEKAGIDGFEMGIIQSVRELPGLLSFLSVFLLLKFREHRLALFFAAMLAVGIAATGFFPSFSGVLLTCFIMSTGFHFFETLTQSMVIQNFSIISAPVILGHLRGMAALATVCAAIVILITSMFFDYLIRYIIIAIPIIFIIIKLLFIDPVNKNAAIQKRKIELKKEYWLYYIITFLGGGRRQIFFVFAPFLLVKKFEYTVVEITILFLINNTINFVLNPLIGRMINHFGERKVASFEYTTAIVLFLVYAFTENAALAGFIYILDQTIINLMIIERTFYQKICKPEDIASGTAMGFTLAHVAAIVIPVVCGMLWVMNYRIAFFAGITIAVFNLVFIQLIDKELVKAAIRKGAK